MFITLCSRIREKLSGTSIRQYVIQIFYSMIGVHAFQLDFSAPLFSKHFLYPKLSITGPIKSVSI